MALRTVAWRWVTPDDCPGNAIGFYENYVPTLTQEKPTMRACSFTLVRSFLFIGCLALLGCKGEPVPASSSSSSSSSSASSSSTSSSASSTGQAAGLNHAFYVGNISHGGKFGADFKQYWNQMAPENEGRWAVVESMRNQNNWSALDKTYNYAKQNGLLFLQYRLFWGSTHTTWAASTPSQELALEAEEWVREYCARYPATDVLEVVGQAINGHMPSVEASRAFGKNWIERVYQFARKYCPNSVLIFSDYNILRWQTEEFIELAKPLAKAGLIDGIGIEAHGIEEFSAAEIQNDLDTLWNELQVPIYITEYDIALTDDTKQLDVLQRQFPVFYHHPHVKGITLYGYLYGKTWVTGSGLIMPDGTHRPSMSWLMNFLEQNPK